MNLKSFFSLLIINCIFFTGNTQSVVQPIQWQKDTAIVNRLLDQSRKHFTSSPDSAISFANQAKVLADEIDYPLGSAIALKNIGIVNYFQNRYVAAIDYYNQSLQEFIKIKDNSGIANLYGNIGTIYYDRGDDTKALENYLQSLKYAELANDKYRTFIALNNLGAFYYLKAPDNVRAFDKALDYYTRAMILCEELGKQEELGAISVNIGSMYFDKKDDAKALLYFQKAIKAYGESENSLNAYNAMGKLYTREGKFDLAIKDHNKALTIAEKVNNKLSILQTQMGLGNVYEAKKDYHQALQFYTKAEANALDIQANHELKDLYDKMATTYSKISDYSKAYKYQTLYTAIKDTLYNIDTDKKLGLQQFDFDLQKKQTEINLLTKDKDLQAVKIKRQQFAKNALLIGLCLAFIIALLIFRSYRIKVKTHKILDKQKNEIEELLLNILPVEVAKELQSTGHATPRHYESVSVMFTDFKGFTIIADKLSPDDLVEELDACFIAFDAIIEKYHLEKIKTIGDSYMCAGGIPTPEENHVLKIVKAGLEIQNYVIKYNEKRREKGLAPWDVRIGIHVGPVVAGVVGKKKYAYDIWGSTVNIASRMESNGEPGRVNISSATYELIKDFYDCSYRGKIYAKNVGEIDMYFIEQEHKIPLTLALKEHQEELND